jgi:hypothetical protein
MNNKQRLEIHEKVFHKLYTAKLSFNHDKVLDILSLIDAYCFAVNGNNGEHNVVILLEILVTRRGGYIGLFKTQELTHLAWRIKKHGYACRLAELQENPKVAEALLNRYKLY